MEKKSIFDSFRRPSGNKNREEMKDKKHRSEETGAEGSDRKTWPGEEKLPDPIRRVTPSAKPRQRASDDDARRGRELPENLNLTLRSSPSGPRGLPGENNKRERPPYEPKYFPRSDSLSSLNGPSPTKAAISPIQGARSMSQAGTRNDYDMSSNKGRHVPRAQAFDYPPRRDSMLLPMRRGQSTSDDQDILNLPLSQAYDIKKGPRHLPAVPVKNDHRGSSHGEIAEATPTLGRYPSTPRKTRQRSKLDQETSVDNQSNGQGREQPGIIKRWGTYSSQNSPKVPLTPGRSVSNGAQMQEWLQQNAQVLKKFHSPERTKNRGKYDHLSPRHKNEAEAFEKFKAASHRRKVSIEVIRKAQEAMIGYPPKKHGSRSKRSPSTVRKGSARYGMRGQQNLSPVTQKRLPEIRYPPEEMPSPFLSPEEKLQRAAQKSPISRKPVQSGYSALQYPDNQQLLQPIEYQFEESPEPISKQPGAGRSRIPTPSKSIKRKTLQGPSMSDLAAKRALEYEKLAGANPFENINGVITPTFGLTRSYPEQNIAIRAIATPTYEEVDSEPFEFPELVPRPLNIVKKRAVKESTIRAVLGRKPTLRTSKTQGPTSSTGNRGYWGYGNRTKSDDLETWKGRRNQGDSVQKINDQIDDYLDLLLKDRIEDKLAEGEVERERERVASRSTNERHYYYYSDQSDSDDDQLYHASMAAERNRREELSAEEVQSSPSFQRHDTGTAIEASRDVASSEELSPEKQEVIAVKVHDKWAEMRAKLRVESTYSDLSVLARSPNP